MMINISNVRMIKTCEVVLIDAFNEKDIIVSQGFIIFVGSRETINLAEPTDPFAGYLSIRQTTIRMLAVTTDLVN